MIPQTIPPELMKMMGPQKLQGPVVPPALAPMTTPQPKMGNHQAALPKVQMALDLMEQALIDLSPDSDEYGAVLSAVSTLHKKFHSPAREKARGLIPSELMTMMAGMPKPGGVPQPPQAPPQSMPAPAGMPMQ